MIWLNWISLCDHFRRVISVFTSQQDWTVLCNDKSNQYSGHLHSSLSVVVYLYTVHLNPECQADPDDSQPCLDVCLRRQVARD